MSQATNAVDESGVAGSQGWLAGHWHWRCDVGACSVVARRAAELRAAAGDAADDGEDCLEPVCEHSRFWNASVEAFDSGVLIYDCPYDGPSMEQDDWLRGWLTAQLESGETQRGNRT
ncbi:MAG TPA: hypothetical protein VG125_33815 [Pirellulales bacterium]|jgi:hypothetical protein|nr:hypothetical protein [Pirellulales bacterium]